MRNSPFSYSKLAVQRKSNIRTKIKEKFVEPYTQEIKNLSRKTCWKKMLAHNTRARTSKVKFKVCKTIRDVISRFHPRSDHSQTHEFEVGGS